MSLTVQRITNQPIGSNCYILYEQSCKSCIAIDPGTLNNAALLGFLSDSRLYPKTVILTHEHFDHCAGADVLATEYNFRLIASEQAAVRIKSSKTNFSAYYEAFEPFEVLHPVDVMKDGCFIEFGNHKIICMETPGHSPGSMCYIIDNYIFTGDTLLNNTKTPLKLPGGNKEQHRQSLEKLKTHLKPGIVVYPGHGNPFAYKHNEQFNN